MPNAIVASAQRRSAYVVGKLTSPESWGPATRHLAPRVGPRQPRPGNPSWLCSQEIKVGSTSLVW